MSDASKEMTKQLELYADAITAFATAQLLSFTYLMAQGSCFTRNVLNHVWIPIVMSILVNAAYITLVHLCHRAEDGIVRASESREGVIDGIVTNIWKIRYIILVVDCAMTVGVFGLILLGVTHNEFHFDCKG